MPNVGGQKLKILRIYQILLEQSDETNQLNAADIIRALKEYDIPAERKSIYKDMETLIDADIDVVKGEHGYYIGSREFELPELKLLVDAVGASKFISKKKSAELLKKLEGLTSKDQAKQLSRQIIVPDRVKTDNEKSFYTIDSIYSSIDQDRQLSFQYEEWTIEKKKALRHNGERYVVSPCFLIRNDENYYLVAFDEKAEAIRHYRVDKMVNTNVEEKPRGGAETRRDLNPEEYAKLHVSMFSGNETVVSIRCDKNLVGVLLDKFGTEISIRPDGESKIKARISVAVSSQFYGWLAGIGGKVVAPEDEALKYKEFLTKIIGE